MSQKSTDTAKSSTIKEGDTFSASGNFILNGDNAAQIGEEFTTWLTYMTEKFSVKVSSYHFNCYFKKRSED